jgi:hypothetical protein
VCRPFIDGLAFGADDGEAAPVGVEDLAVQDGMGQPFGGGLVEGLVEVRCLGGQDVDAFVEVPVGGGLGQGECLAVPGDVRVSRNQAITNMAWKKQVRRLLPCGVPRRRRSAYSRWPTKRISSRGTSSVAGYEITWSLPATKTIFWRDLFYRWLHVCFPALRSVRESARTSLSLPQNARLSESI